MGNSGSDSGNLFAPESQAEAAELFQVLLEARGFTLSRIVSHGQASPPGCWYDQEQHEWVALLTGRAGLLIEGEAEPRLLEPGDFLLLPAHRRHRVEWTDPDQPTVWLALHYSPQLSL